MGGDATTENARITDPRSGLSHEAIRAQLDRILGHREFQATDKMRDFLRFVVEEKLAGRAHRLKGYTIATEVFGRSDDFDSAHDPIVRIQAGRLRRALERYYLVAGGRDPVLIDVPKGRYIPTFARQAAPSVAAHAGTPGSADERPLPTIGPSVAVLPLDNLTGDPDQLFFTVGLAEELMTELSRFQDLAVVSCQNPSAVRSALTAPDEIGRSVGARFVLQGSVRRDPRTLKVAMHLTDTANGHRIWAEDYSHPAEAGQLIATQERIARDVVAAIASEYGIIARRLSAESRKKAPAELDTYEAMLRYYSHQVSPSPESAAACFPALQRAVEHEPEFGPAWSALATLYCQMYTFDVPGFEVALETALQFARRGVSLEPGSQLGRLILAYTSYVADDDDSFHQEIETALALNPNSPYTVGAAGYMHSMRGEFEAGLPLLDRAIAVNPSHPNWFHSAHVVHYLVRQEYELALAESDRHSPHQSYFVPLVYAAMLGKLGRLADAKPHVEQLLAVKPDFPSRPFELLHRILKIDGLIDDMVDGLRQAGMPVDYR
jgi:adenylate cyclase